LVDTRTGPERPPAATKADGDFEVLFRLYAPTKVLFDKTWTLPDIEKIAAQ